MIYIFFKNQISILPRLTLLLFIVIFSAGCLSLKPSTTKSGKKLFETFYVGEEGTQYYIKPLLFEDQESKEKVFLDLTFRYKNEIKDSAIVNLTIEGPYIYKAIRKIRFNGANNIESNQIEFIFNEKNKNEFVSRFTSKIALKDIENLFNNANWSLTLYSDIRTINGKPNKKTIKSIHTLHENVFSIM